MPACTTCGRHVPRQHEEEHATAHVSVNDGADRRAVRLIPYADAVPIVATVHVPDLGSDIPNEGNEDTTTEEEA